MRQRRVTVREVLEALCNPVELAYDKSKDVYIALGGNGVAVVYAYRGSYYEVVTVLREAEYHSLVYRVGRRRYRLLYSLDAGATGTPG